MRDSEVLAWPLCIRPVIRVIRICDKGFINGAWNIED